MGNHDHRDNFWNAFAESPAAGAKPEQRPIQSRQITVIESPRVNWLLLDSLVTTNTTPGKLGDEQLQWLTAALDARADKPAMVMVHHNPDPMNSKSTALTDTDALYAILAPRRQVKALIFGHTHHWDYKQYEGIHLINLPTVAYPFKKGEPNGWVHCRLTDGGGKFELRALDTQHARQGETLDLKWRA
jgi:3',5'-cyclic AMP phosphodiesterase CpdA